MNLSTIHISPREVILSWIFVFVTILFLWPPRFIYWEIVAGFIGSTVVLGIISILSVFVGLGFKKYTEFKIYNFLIGGVLAYMTIIVLTEVIIMPESPAHFILYGILLSGVLGGGLVDYVCENTIYNYVSEP